MRGAIARAKVESGGKSGFVSIEKTQYDPSRNKGAKCRYSFYEELTELWSVERSLGCRASEPAISRPTGSLTATLGT